MTTETLKSFSEVLRGPGRFRVQPRAAGPAPLDLGERVEYVVEAVGGDFAGELELFGRDEEQFAGLEEAFDHPLAPSAEVAPLHAEADAAQDLVGDRVGQGG